MGWAYYGSTGHGLGWTWPSLFNVIGTPWAGLLIAWADHGMCRPRANLENVWAGLGLSSPLARLALCLVIHGLVLAWAGLVMG
jgi:hypothetical protein